jgi:hypothetical protein
VLTLSLYGESDKNIKYMIAQDIIEKFELQVDDSTELSSVEELALLNKCYQKICDDRPWEFLKTEFSGLTDGSNKLALPSNFSYFIERNDDGEKIVWGVGVEYLLVPFNNRRKYTGQSNVCYVNDGYLYFMVAPASNLVVLGDYIKVPNDLAIDNTPIFPERFHPMLSHLMAIEDITIQGDPSADHIINKNNALYKSMLADMQYYNARLSEN